MPGSHLQDYLTVLDGSHIVGGTTQDEILESAYQRIQTADEACAVLDWKAPMVEIAWVEGTPMTDQAEHALDLLTAASQSLKKVKDALWDYYEGGGRDADVFKPMLVSQHIQQKAVEAAIRHAVQIGVCRYTNDVKPSLTVVDPP